MGRAKIAAAVLALLLIGTGIFWFAQSRQELTKSDCDIAADMMTYRKTVGDEISSAAHNEDMDNPTGFLIGKYNAWLNEEPKYVDQIHDSNVKSRAQAVADSDKGFIEYQLEKLSNPQPSYPPDDAKITESLRRTEMLVNRQVGAAKALQTVCPNIKPYSNQR